MKKVAILTINDYNNYGNRLQNYATQEVLKSLGCSVKTIVNNTEFDNSDSYEKKSLKNKISRLKYMSVKKVCIKVKIKIVNKLYDKKIKLCKIRRLEAFKEFTKDNILETNYFISYGNIPSDISNRFDYFVTGSDQVWNPTFRYGSEIDFLTFASKNKRIAYSPSFGISEIPSKYIEKYKVMLSEMNKLSVREKSGAKIIKELTGRDAIVLIDPTLMLTKNQWMSISKESNSKPRCKYILTYFLDEISDENKSIIKSIAKTNKLKIINLGNIKDLKAYESGPSEFIDYINSASILFTDSFHGSVFSILLDTPFVVINRGGKFPSMNSRIETLLETFKLESRKLSNVVANNQFFEVNYSHVEPILKSERDKSINYLKSALNIE